MKSAFDALDGLQVRLAIPDLWQQEAVRHLQSGADVIVDAPTGAGKTFVFEQAVGRGNHPRHGEQAVFTVPTRALANDKWREWKADGWKVGLATGDLAVDLDAPVLVATLETQRERLLAGEGPRMLVIDEYQMIGHERRGLNYELALALAPPATQLLLLSGSVANPEDVAAWLRRLGRRVEVVQTRRRPVPLDDIPLEALPEQAPARVKGFWQRLALGVLLSDFGPLLVFAPQRRAAEKIARQIAEALPDDDPIEFSDQIPRRACGPDLAKLLRKRVAWHHSGLSFAQRGGIVEPLAKAGQLRVIVATMGLAAGINFSVRSVFVSGTLYQDGPFQREIAPDELLQMFGRAGRRGLDENGYAITSGRGPRLMDARARQLRRSNEIDWPTLLRVMNRAADEERSPFDAARELTARLFSEQRIVLGFRGESGGDPGEIMSGARREGEGLFGLKPTRREILNLAGDWEPEPAPGGASAEAPLAGAWLHRGGRWVSALSDAAFVSGLLPPHCRLCRLDRHEGNGGGKRFGGELALATRTRDGAWLPTRPARAIARLPRDLSTLSREEVETLLPEMLAEGLGGGAGAGFVERGNALSMLLSFAEKTMAVLRDRAGHALIDPPRREVAVEAETHYKDRDTGETRGSAAGSAARAWRKLGLTDEHGKPTERGTLFSFFQRGEGLAVAAGIEDESYPIDELLWHLVNLRAGYRFSMADVAGEGHGSERLAAACRRAYGPVDYEGYLQLGVPPGYGEGAAEAVEAWLSGDLARKRDRSRLGDDDEAGPGDIERAYIEWLSLLRHLRAAPTHPNPRWRALKDAAAAELKQRGATASPGAHWPTLPASILQRHPQHRLSFRRLGPAR